MWRHLFEGTHHTRGSAQNYVLAGGFISAPAWMPAIAQINEYIPLASFGVGVVVAGVRIWSDLKRANRED